MSEQNPSPCSHKVSMFSKTSDPVKESYANMLLCETCNPSMYLIRQSRAMTTTAAMAMSSESNQAWKTNHIAMLHEWERLERRCRGTRSVSPQPTPEPRNEGDRLEEEDWRQRALRTETCLCRSRHKHEIWLQQMCLNRAGRQRSSRSMPDLVPKLSMMLARFLDDGDGQITFLVLKGSWCSFLLGWSFCWGAGWWLYSRQDIRRWSRQATRCRWRKIEILWNSRR